MTAPGETRCVDNYGRLPHELQRWYSEAMTAAEWDDDGDDLADLDLRIADLDLRIADLDATTEPSSAADERDLDARVAVRAALADEWDVMMRDRAAPARPVNAVTVGLSAAFRDFDPRERARTAVHDRQSRAPEPGVWPNMETSCG